MKIDRKWLVLGGALAGGAVALALGVPLGTLLIVGALLACPIMMMFGMRGMHGPAGMAGHPGSQEAGRQEAGPPAPSPDPSRSGEPAQRS